MDTSIPPKTPDPLPARRRRGISSLEVLVSLTLLTSVLALATPLIVAHGRLLKQQRNYRLALDELSNQHQRLSKLPAEELSAAIEALAPSPLAAERLPGAALRGALADSQFGRRLTLEIWWDEPNRDGAPVRLTAWFAAAAEGKGSGVFGGDEPVHFAKPLSATDSRPLRPASDGDACNEEAGP